jgi:hypothetical protein
LSFLLIHVMSWFISLETEYKLLVILVSLGA